MDRAAWKAARRARADAPCFNVTYRRRSGENVTYRCGDRLLDITKLWLKEPASSILHRPPFETCLETGALSHPSTANLKAWRIQAEQARCDRVRELPADRLWIALDCSDYGHRPRPSEGNTTAYHRMTPLSLCAPPHVAVACLSCSRQHMRAGLDMGLPPVTPRLRALSAHPLLPRSRAEVEHRCRGHASDPLRLAAVFRGSSKHGTTYKRTFRSRMVDKLHGQPVSASLGAISARLTDVGSQRPPVTNSTSMEADLAHAQFGLVPRGDSYYSYRFVEASTSPYPAQAHATSA
jgi:hypothetical protein